MKQTALFLLLLLTLSLFTNTAQAALEKDIIKTSGGNLTITFIKHGSLMFQFQGKVIHVTRSPKWQITAPCQRQILS